MYVHHLHAQTQAFHMHPPNRDPIHTHAPPPDWYRANGWAPHTTDLQRSQPAVDPDEWDRREAEMEVGRRETAVWGMRQTHANPDAKYQLNADAEEWDRLEMETQFGMRPRHRKDEMKHTGRPQHAVDASRFAAPLSNASEIRGLSEARTGQMWSTNFADSGHAGNMGHAGPTSLSRAGSGAYGPSAGTTNESYTR